MLKRARIAQFTILELLSCKSVIASLAFKKQMEATLPVIKSFQISNNVVHEVTLGPLTYNLFSQLYLISSQSMSTVRRELVQHTPTTFINSLEKADRLKFIKTLKQCSKNRRSLVYPVQDVPSRYFMPHILLYPEVGQHWFVNPADFIENSLVPSINIETQGIILCYPTFITNSYTFLFSDLSIESGLDIDMGYSTTLEIFQDSKSLSYELDYGVNRVYGGINIPCDRLRLTRLLMDCELTLYHREPSFDLWVTRGSKLWSRSAGSAWKK